MIKAEEVKKYLFAQAQQKISTNKEIKNIVAPLIKTASKHDVSIELSLITEAQDRLARIKEGSIEKEAMAQTTGTGGFQRSWNIKYHMRDLGAREQEIKAAIESQYAPYMYEEIREKGIQERKVGLPAGLYGNPRGNTLELTGDLGDPTVPNATLVMRFDFERTVVPLESENAEANQKATDAIRVIDEIAPGFSDLVNLVESSNIPLNPFFHTSSFPLDKGGGINAASLKPFMMSEKNRLSRSGLRVYEDHLEALSNRGESQRLTVQDSGKDRLLKTRDIFNVTHTAYLGDALVSKIKDGYTLNQEGLLSDIRRLRDLWLERLGITGSAETWTRTQRDYVRAQNKFYNQMAQNIITYFNNGCAWQSGEPEHQRFTIVDDQSRNRFRALPGWENVNSKHIKCPLLRITEWHLLVKNCTKSVSSEHELAPDDFYIPKYNVTHKPNGMDYSPNNMSRMLVTPPLRGLPPTEHSRMDANNRPVVKLMYDRDNGNISRDHLVKNWRNQNGGLQSIFADGDKYKTMLDALRNPQIRERLPAHVKMAWDSVFTNRTSAESAFDTSRKYRTYDDLYNHVLRNSYATEREQYNKAIENYIPGDPVCEAAKQYRMSGDWDAFRSVLSDGLSGTDLEHMMQPQDFPVYQRYVYPIAKILDFLSALMYASCEEKVSKIVGSGRNRRQVDTVIYGSKYSTSSGVAEGGQLMIGMKYAFPAPQVSDDPEIVRALKTEWRKRNSLQRPKGPTQRVTQWPQHSRNEMEPLPGHEDYWAEQPFPGDPAGRERPIDFVAIKVVEDLEYFIGLGTKNGMVKDVTPSDVNKHNWFDVLESFRQSHWTLEEQLGIAISPINKNFEAIERAAKESIDAVRREIETGLTSQGQPTQIALYYQNARGVDLMVSPSLPVSPNEATESESEQEPVAVGSPATPQTSQPYNAPQLQRTQAPQQQPQAPQNQELPPDVTQDIDQTQVGAPGEERPMLMEPNFVGKKKEKRQLIRQPVAPGKLSRSEVIERIKKVADALDARGLTNLSSRFDILLKKVVDAC